MIQREDILSMEYLKKSEYTGCHLGMRYRLERIAGEEGKEKLKATIWPEPFNYFQTADALKTSAVFDFSEDGVVDAVAWMNDRLFEDKDKWDRAGDNWSSYRMR